MAAGMITESGTDLSWVRFEGSDETCEAPGPPPCRKQAVCWLVVDAYHDDMLACAEHRDKAVAAQEKVGYFAFCCKCDAMLELRGIDPL